MKKKSRRGPKDQTEILIDLLITQLAVAGVRQVAIREIIGCDIHRVSRILKHVNTARKKVQPIDHR